MYMYIPKRASTQDSGICHNLPCPGLLPAGAHMVFNESKVFSARMFARLPQKSEPVEVMFLAPHTQAHQLPVNAAQALVTGLLFRNLCELPE